MDTEIQFCNLVITIVNCLQLYTVQFFWFTLCMVSFARVTSLHLSYCMSFLINSGGKGACIRNDREENLTVSK